jgi:hypothetical protein
MKRWLQIISTAGATVGYTGFIAWIGYLLGDKSLPWWLAVIYLFMVVVSLTLVMLAMQGKPKGKKK